jgi:hypothetical protein
MSGAGRIARPALRALAAGYLAAAFASVLVFASPAGAAAGAAPASDGAADQKQKPWDGNRTTPAHFIPLRDETNALIVPTDANPMPFSARYTCGPCHEYKTVQGGWHWNAMKSEKNGRPGEPWIWLDPKTGTVLPLSYRKWPGTWDPKRLELNPWDFTMLFGRHMPGGGPAEPGEEVAFPGMDARWSVSGKAELNCLACHNKSGRQDESEWAKQVMRQNLRWAATAASGIGEVGGMASRLHETWDVYDGPSLDDHEWAVAPSVKYRTVDFDGKHRFFFDIAYPPDDRNCLVCHSVSPVTDVRATSPVDVHTAKGIKCAECHRNGLGHGITRGYEGEAADTGDRSADSFTCRGCHFGEDADGKRLVVPGRLGAPYPKHTGIPLVHFRRLECTVCHAGPVPEKGWTRVRTSRANRLGVYGIAQWSTDQPAVMEPVYMRDERGAIGPRRLVWPAFWARTEGKDIVPLQPGVVETAAGDSLKCEERIAGVLTALAQACGENEVAALNARGWLFEVNVDGGLDATAMVAPDKGGIGNGGVPFWGTKKDGALSPLVPDFDPAAADKDAAAEPHVQSVLEALATVAGAPGKPVVVVRKTLYQMTNGNLALAEAPAEFAGASGPGWLAAKKFEPLAAEFDVRTVAAKAGTEQTLTEEQVGLVLKALAAGDAKGPAAGKEGGSAYVYFSGGREFRLDKGGKLRSETADEAAAPVTWPLAHNVRPVQQSLGWNGCTDCHTADSKFFFKTAKGTGPLLTKAVAARSAASFMGVGSTFHRVFGLTFAVRPFFKLLLAVTIIATGAVLGVFLFVVAGKLAGLIEKGS